MIFFATLVVGVLILRTLGESASLVHDKSQIILISVVSVSAVSGVMIGLEMIGVWCIVLVVLSDLTGR
jgi:hypothetical protein